MWVWRLKMKKLILLFAILFATGSLALAADTYTIDGAHTAANFTVKHLGISTVHGRFSSVSGTILFDPQAPEKSSVTAVIKSASVTTDNAMRDKDLNSPRFFDTTKFSEIRFQSTSIRKAGDDKYVAVGNLTIRDVTKPVEIPFTLAQGKGAKGELRLGVQGMLTINRFDYNVSYDTTGAVVSKDVNIELDVEAAKQN
jgi:polyisoprenoid-binding protein YceI